MKLHLTIIFGLFVSLTTHAAGQLSDVNNSKFKEAVYFLHGEKVIGGYPDGTFKPENKINRAEFLKILIGARYEKQLQERNYNTRCFDDITDVKQWFVPYACFAQDWGIISGYDDGTLRPSANINVAEAAKIINLVYGSNTATNQDPWYKPYLKFLLENRFLPEQITDANHTLSRAEMAEMITRAEKQEISKLDDYLAYRKTHYNEGYFPTWDQFNNQVESASDTSVTNNTTSSPLTKVSNTPHPGEKITGGYISNYSQWIETSYPASPQNNTISDQSREALSQNLLVQMNKARVRNKQAPYSLNPLLTKAASDFAEHLVLNGFYSHTDLFGNDPYKRADLVGFEGWVAESMVWNSGGPSDAMAWWEQSALHWKNLMDPRFIQAGVGIAQEPNGRYVIVFMGGE